MCFLRVDDRRFERFYIWLQVITQKITCPIVPHRVQVGLLAGAHHTGERNPPATAQQRMAEGLRAKRWQRTAGVLPAKLRQQAAEVLPAKPQQQAAGGLPAKAQQRTAEGLRAKPRQQERITERLQIKTASERIIASLCHQTCRWL